MQKITLAALILSLTTGCSPFNPALHKYLKKANDFIYVRDKYEYWQSPAETEKLNGGDCEDQNLWLYQKLKNKTYDVTAEFGKRHESDKESHSWLELKQNGKVYILDAAWKTYSFTREEYAKDEYIKYTEKYWKLKLKRWERKNLNQKNSQQ